MLGKTYRENPVFITGMGLQCCPNVYTVPWILIGDQKQENFDAF